jgi:Predicted transcriptional regulators
MFSVSAIERVQLAQRSLQLGFSLKELSEILRNRDSGGVPCHRVLKLTEAKLQSLGVRIEELRETQEYMRTLVRQWRQKLKQTPPGSKAMLLHSLVDRPNNNSGQDTLKKRRSGS